MRRPYLYNHRGTWYARFYIGDGPGYETRSLGVPFDGEESRRKAEDAAWPMALDMETARAEAAKAPPDDKRAVGEAPDAPLLDYALDFWADDSPYARKKALVDKEPLSLQYTLSMRQHIKNSVVPFPEFQSVTLGDLKKPMLNRWKLWLAEKGRSGKMINEAMKALRVPVKVAFADDVIPVDPFAGVQRAAHKEKLRGILRPAEIKALLAAPAVDPRSRLCVYLALYCSMRLGEVRGLQWGDIADGVIHICHNWQEGEGVKKCKKGSEGYVPMAGIVAALMNRVHEIAPLTGPGDFVMSIRPGHPLSKENISAFFRAEMDSIGITEAVRKNRNIVFHGLRHSFVTAGRMAGLSDFEIQMLARHKSSVQMDRYSNHRDALDMDSVRLRIEAGFGGGILPAPAP